MKEGECETRCVCSHAASGGDTSHTEEEEEEEEEEVWSPRGAAVGRWRPLLELPGV